MSKIYYYHTTKLRITKEGLVPPCTIAVQKVGNKIKYGVAICSKYDNFSRKTGREVATSRLENGFGHIDIPKLQNEIKDMDDMTQSLTVLWSLTSSVVRRNLKWKKKITKFNKSILPAVV